jgi:hypothetical protein
MTAAHTVTCPSCGGTIEIKAAGYTVNVGCQYCGSVLDVANPDVKVISEFQMAARKLELPLGSRGTIRGIEWVQSVWRLSLAGADPGILESRRHAGGGADQRLRRCGKLERKAFRA